ncbi:MAG: hypothetical protein AAGC55_31675, partial [Myxococcota bacterium]
FLVTFPSVYLRTVFDGSELLEARFMLLELVGYRPTPVTGPAASRIARTLWERSIASAYADRDFRRDVRPFVLEQEEPDSRSAHVRMRHHDAVITTEAPATETVRISVDPGQTVPIEFDGLIHGQAGGATLDIGRDLFGWGHFEDFLADGVAANDAQWSIPAGGENDPLVRIDASSGSGQGYIQLRRHDGLSGETFVRPVARIPMPEYRIYYNDSNNAIPAQGEASYSIRMRARLSGKGQAYLQLRLYNFDDTNPTEDPTTDEVGTIELPIPIDSNDEWQFTEIEVPTEALTSGDLRANVVLVYLRFTPPDEGESVLSFDDFAFIEWRSAEEMNDHFGAYDFFRNQWVNTIDIEVAGLPLSD